MTCRCTLYALQQKRSVTNKFVSFQRNILIFSGYLNGAYSLKTWKIKYCNTNQNPIWNIIKGSANSIYFIRTVNSNNDLVFKYSCIFIEKIVKEIYTFCSAHAWAFVIVKVSLVIQSPDKHWSGLYSTAVDDMLPFALFCCHVYIYEEKNIIRIESLKSHPNLKIILSSVLNLICQLVDKL